MVEPRSLPPCGSAPQWEPFNGDNWLYIENNARDFVEANNFDAVIYTGTNGICRLENVNGGYVDIYLYAEDGAKQLPVPKFYWKEEEDSTETLPSDGTGRLFCPPWHQFTLQL